jgi:hypothetical protein
LGRTEEVGDGVGVNIDISIGHPAAALTHEDPAGNPGISMTVDIGSDADRSRDTGRTDGRGASRKEQEQYKGK